MKMIENWKKLLGRFTDFNITQGKWLFIPVEVKVRELQAKTLLACLAAERGFKVVLGEAHAVRNSLHQLPAGIVLEKGVSPSKVDSFARFRELGNLVVAWCEEGLVFFDDDDYIRRKVSKQDLEQVDCFFAWGQYHADVITKKFPEMKSRVLCSGNARLDLLRPEFRDVFSAETQKIRSTIGPFILVNTNFSHCNHKKGEGGYLEVLRNAGKITSEAEEAFAAGWMAHKKRLFDAFVPMVRRVSEKFPEYKVIVRPHPGENHETWRIFFETDSNVEVVHQGGAVPWILASSVVLHNGCTTGIEAFLLEHPAVAYRPVISDVYDQFLPNSVNFQADNEDQLIESLDLLLNQRNVEMFVNNPDWKKNLYQYVSGSTGMSACDIILDKVSSIHHNIKPLNRRPWYFLHKLHLKLYMNINTLANRNLVGTQERGEYSMHKFSGLDLSELQHEIERLKSTSGKLSSVDLTCLGENIFLMSKAHE
ncbi:MAG: hypothetical protein D3910_03670 [Candidatus Electrothrix sp. ATG2]|nr:hypothetical protein [Candidatus Electrothrix sp. ATG2]